MAIKISVIVPIHNISAYAQECVRGLLAQTLTGFEVLFVDDGSDDDSFGLIESLMAAKEREDISYKLFHNESNRGVACSRNVGLDNSEGEYVYFVDADDRIEPATLEILYNAAKDRDADVSGCEWYLSFSRNERHIRQKDVRTGVDLFNAFAEGVMRWNLWLFMVRRSVIEENGFRFLPGMNMGEDMMLMMKVALASDKVVITHLPLYHYIQTNSGAQTKNWSKENRDQVTANAAEVERFCKSRAEDFSTQINLLKLNLKLPFIISDCRDDFEVWMNWFPEANEYIKANKSLPRRTKYIQLAAASGRFGIVRLYYRLVIKFIYGVLFK